MANPQPVCDSGPETGALLARYRRVRAASERLAAPLAVEDQVVQTIPEVSPTKWHLAHVTWFFERFCLLEHLPGYRPIDERYHYLFNSYYYTAGAMHERPRRGLLSRPTVSDIRDYRARVDEAMTGLIARRGDDDRTLRFLVELGLNHEQQHQELLLTDIKHVFFCNPLGPAYDALPEPPGAEPPEPLAFLRRPGGLFEIGSDGEGFCFDNETPRHRVLLTEHALAHRLVTNAEYRRFIEEGGYDQPALWLSDGWARVSKKGLRRPLYWSEDLESEFTLGGWREIDPHAPVCHVSYYEADAFARLAGARLPSEAEWELAAEGRAVEGNLLDTGLLQPMSTACRASAEIGMARSGEMAPAAAPGAAAAPHAETAAPHLDERGPAQLFGDVWEWTAAPYGPYPGFKPLAGSLGEYNGKFMCSQMVVRGGSCVTWAEHLRATYRSFFYPHDRWQFLGIRLAKGP